MINIANGKTIEAGVTTKDEEAFNAQQRLRRYLNNTTGSYIANRAKEFLSVVDTTVKPTVVQTQEEFEALENGEEVTKTTIWSPNLTETCTPETLASFDVIIDKVRAFVDDIEAMDKAAIEILNKL